MTDSPPTGPDSQRQDADRTAPLSVAEAAAALGVTPDAIRARLHRGTLAGEKVDGTWQVYSLADRERQDATVDPTAQQETDRMRQPVGRQDATGTPTGPAIDLAPLVDELHAIRIENRQLAEAAAVWQLRALQAEGRLKQLTAGTPDPTEAAGNGTENAENAGAGIPHEPALTAPAEPSSLWHRVRHWLRGP